jgi:hypothetical protein
MHTVPDRTSRADLPESGLDHMGKPPAICTHEPLYSSFMYSSHQDFFLYLILPHPSILYIILYSLWGPLVTLSKYIHVTSYFEVFIETNLMIQSKFNLVLWFTSYNIFCWLKQWDPPLHLPCTSGRSRSGHPAGTPKIADERSSAWIADRLTYSAADVFPLSVSCRTSVADAVQSISGYPHSWYSKFILYTS